MSRLQAWDGMLVVAEEGKAVKQYPKKLAAQKCFKAALFLFSFSGRLRVTSTPDRWNGKYSSIKRYHNNGKAVGLSEFLGTLF